MLQVEWSITDQAAGLPLSIGMIKQFDEQFNEVEWKDSLKARELINKAKDMINSNPTKEGLKMILQNIYSCMHNPNKTPSVEKGGRNLLG